ncbi:hypothetical protein ABMA27_012193 [Loxostege sticticalis]|uniref:PCNA-associated factor n=1 Tax=Loxostege sticticalis TaxID=481309 RepID=A0ABR3H0H7_LOXSC
MARTKASVGAKVASGKSSKARCSVAPAASSAGSSGSSEKSRGSSGGNAVCPRETPKWQKPITNFFICKDNRNKDGSDTEENDSAAAGSSKPKPKRNVIESDEEECTERPTNTVLDETIELEPLNGEDSHKIEEYYNKNAKGKGVGKKTKDKENVDVNVEKRNSVKRDLEELTLEEEMPASKKVKVN